MSAKSPAPAVESAHVPIEHLRILRKALALKLVGLSDTQIARLEKAGLFPKRVYIGDNSVGWLEADVRAWIEDRITHGKFKPSGALAPAKKARKGARA